MNRNQVLNNLIRCPLILFSCTIGLSCVGVLGEELDEPRGECGDGRVQPDVEVCDDGDTEETGWCSADCQVLHQGECGDGVVNDWEVCDDGNVQNFDYCSYDCQRVLSVCGDGILADDEECEDLNDTRNDGCTNCQIENGWFCEGNPSLCTPGLESFEYERNISHLSESQMIELCQWLIEKLDPDNNGMVRCDESPTGVANWVDTEYECAINYLEMDNSCGATVGDFFWCWGEGTTDGCVLARRCSIWDLCRWVEDRE